MSVVVTEPTSLVAVADQCSKLEIWAEQCESIPELQDANNKLAAVDDYLHRTSTEGRSRVAAAMRRLEVRIGKLLGPPLAPQESGSLQGSGATEPLTRHQRTEFRKLAENEDTVEEVIAQSTDDAPASRRRTLRAIDGHPEPTAPGTRVYKGRPADEVLGNVVTTLRAAVQTIRSLDSATLGDEAPVAEWIREIDRTTKELRSFRAQLRERYGIQ